MALFGNDRFEDQNTTAQAAVTSGNVDPKKAKQTDALLKKIQAEHPDINPAQVRKLLSDILHGKEEARRDLALEQLKQSLGEIPSVVQEHLTKDRITKTAEVKRIQEEGSLLSVIRQRMTDALSPVTSIAKDIQAALLPPDKTVQQGIAQTQQQQPQQQVQQQTQQQQPDKSQPLKEQVVEAKKQEVAQKDPQKDTAKAKGPRVAKSGGKPKGGKSAMALIQQAFGFGEAQVAASEPLAPKEQAMQTGYNSLDSLAAGLLDKVAKMSQNPGIALAMLGDSVSAPSVPLNQGGIGGKGGVGGAGAKVT